MTNGEKLKEVFPSIKLYEKSHDAIQINFDSVWWNAEYKEPTTKNDLGVDKEERELALMYLEQIKEDYIEGVGYERHPLPEYYAIETAIKSLVLPSVTPQEPRKGHWTYNRANVRCSCCGKGYKDFYGKANIASYNYCPNCGADMSEVEG